VKPFGMGLLQDISSILYFDNNGGPTVVLEQTATAAGLAPRVWKVYPKSRRLVAFPGTLVHGVLPGGTPAPDTPRQLVGHVLGSHVLYLQIQGTLSPTIPLLCCGKHCCLNCHPAQA
jgi:hypothetical protein